MRRRVFMAGAAAICAAPLTALAHTPYGQWVTYRRKHLLIGCHRGDPETYAMAKVLVRELEHALPEASARVARGPRPQRIASLMGTEQLDLAILGRGDAEAMIAGEGIFEPYGPIALSLLAPMEGGKVLIARDDFRTDHAWLVAAATEGASIVSAGADGAGAAIGWHAGAKAWRNGEPMPPAPG